MRNFLKVFSIYAVCFVLALSFFAVPSFASSVSLSWVEERSLTSPYYCSRLGDFFESEEPYTGTLYYATTSGPLWVLVDPNEPVILQPGTYVIYGTSLPSSIGDNSNVALSGVLLLRIVAGEQVSEYYDFGQPFTVTADTVGVVVQSYDVAPVIQTYVEPFSLYSSAWDLLKFYIYGDIEMTPEMNLTLTLLATLIALAVVVLPFIIIWLIIRYVSSLLR